MTGHQPAEPDPGRRGVGGDGVEDRAVFVAWGYEVTWRGLALILCLAALAGAAATATGLAGALAGEVGPSVAPLSGSSGATDSPVLSYLLGVVAFAALALVCGGWVLRRRGHPLWRRQT